MTSIIFFIIKNTVENIEEKGKLYFTLKIQEYADEKLESKKEEKEETKSKNDELNDASPEKTLIYVEGNHNYEIDEIFRLTKTIEKKFAFNSQQLIRNFIDKKAATNNDLYYYNLAQMKKKIDQIGVYNILVGSKEFIDKVVKDLQAINPNIVKEYFYHHTKFDINDFINYITVEMDKNDPTIYVFVGKKNENYNHIDSRIKTIYKKSIYKGLKIIYKNKMYDFSLS